MSEERSDMDTTEKVRRLSLFGIPQGDSREVREMLARLVAAESLSLGELQLARDIVKRVRCEDDAAYLFLAAMCISERGGNAFLRPGKGAELLERAGYLEEYAKDGMASNEEYRATVRASWSAALSAAESLDGDVVVKRKCDDGDRWFFRRNLAAVEAVTDALARREAEVAAAKASAAETSDSSPSTKPNTARTDIRSQEDIAAEKTVLIVRAATMTTPAWNATPAAPDSSVGTTRKCRK